MKIIRFALFLIGFVSCASFGATSSDFQNAANLLTAARRGDVQTMQFLINSGADVNYVDSTGLSLVCTAVMNNDRRAIQILQMYGADASNCDRQIKKYRQRTRTAASGDEYGFFSGLSSSHILVLSALGVAAVVGGLVLLTDVFDSDNDNNSWGSGGSHGGGSGGGGSGSASQYFSIPYGPAYLTSTGALDTGFDISENLLNWGSTSSIALNATDFNFLRTGTSNNFISKGLNPLLQNYLLAMRGYYAFASGYMGQNIFRDATNAYAPVKPAIDNAQGRPVRVALITGNGINPSGSADSANGITYAVSTALDSSTPTVDKYLNNTLSGGVETENTGYDFSGSGSAFNPFADVNDSALAKIVAGWEGGRAADVGDLYGFVPNGQLAIYRTGNGSVWNELPVASREQVGTFNDTDGVTGLSYVANSETPDTLTINGITYTIQTALSLTTVTNPTVTINGVTFDLASNSNLFVGVCPAELTDCTNIAIYVGTDGGWYVNSTGGNDFDIVYTNVGGNVYTYKEKVANGIYTNFQAMTAAVGTNYNVPGDTSSTGVDLIANVNVIPASRNTNYVTVKTFTKAANDAGVSDLKTFYSNEIDSYYGVGQGGIANSLFNNYNSSKPMLIMPAGDYLYRSSTGETNYLTLDATFENYAPIVYGNNLSHDFMTIVGVSHLNGTSTATTVSGYGDGTGSSYGKIRLSMWYDGDDLLTSNVYASRKCGIAGTGNGSVDPWCFAAIGPTAEMATASAAGAVASVKSAFSYMTNDQIFTLLALTADGPYLAANTDGTVFSTDSLYEYLRGMYELPYEYDEDSLSVDDYLNAFKDVFGYGLINLERAVKPGFSVYYYDSASGNIVSTNGANNKFWGNVSTNSSRASSVLSLTNRGAITTSFYDILESADGTLSLPRVWNQTLASNDDYGHGLYIGDLLGDFVVDSKAKTTNKIGNMEFGMSLSPRAYDDNLNGLDNLRVAFVSSDFDVVGQYQRYLTDGESRFSGRANGVLALAANAVSSDVVYKVGNLGFGARAFSGAITDESLLENDPVISSRFEPGRLGFANGGAFDVKYNNDRFNFGASFGVMHETDTVLGMYSDGLLSLRGGNTRYVDAVVEYKPIDKVKLSLRGTFAQTSTDKVGDLISCISDIKSNAFAFGADIGGLGLTVALPLAVVDGRMGYSYAEFMVDENDDGEYQVLLNNPHTEYVDLSPQKRELRFTTSYKKSLSELSDAGVEFMYRVHPNNTDVFGNESVLMFKVHRRIGF